MKLAKNRKPRAKSEVDGFLKQLMQKIKDTPAKDYPEIALYLWLTYYSIKTFGQISMGWYGPLAYKLAQVPSYDNTSVSIGVLGVDLEMPNSQTVGLVMLAFMGILDLFDSIKLGLGRDWRGVTSEQQLQAQKSYVESLGMTWEDYLNFRKYAT